VCNSHVAEGAVQNAFILSNSPLLAGNFHHFNSSATTNNSSTKIKAIPPSARKKGMPKKPWLTNQKPPRKGRFFYCHCQNPDIRDLDFSGLEQSQLNFLFFHYGTKRFSDDKF
jgi:hypothetical protein